MANRSPGIQFSPQPGATRRAHVCCFGEALWDVLPRGIFLGGAPLNVAYHLSRHGITPWMVSAVGRDFLGDEILRRVKAWGLTTRFIARLPNRPTGTVLATLDTRGAATYRIARDVAWDAIRPAAPRRPAPAALVFGTLALRGASNRRALDQLIGFWPGALRALDLNLRPPFTEPAVIAFALQRAQLLKLNDDELATLDRRRGHTPAQFEAGARRLARRHELAGVCVTAGARGAGLLWQDRWHWEAARRVDVRDTVGAGDSFLGALLANLLRDTPPAAALARACRVGEFIATRDGATPAYQVDNHGRPRDTAR